MDKTVLWDAPGFPFVVHLSTHFAEIQSEADQLEQEDYDDWPQRGAYSGTWKVFCFFSRDPNWHLAASCPAHAVRCQRTLRSVRQIPGVSRAGFSLLLPGTHIAPHRDGQDGNEDLVRCHMALRTNPKSGMRFGQKAIVWERGRCIIFDGLEEHEAANMGDTPAVVMIVDIDRDAMERVVPSGTG